MNKYASIYIGSFNKVAAGFQDQMQGIEGIESNALAAELNGELPRAQKMLGNAVRNGGQGNSLVVQDNGFDFPDKGAFPKMRAASDIGIVGPMQSQANPLLHAPGQTDFATGISSANLENGYSTIGRPASLLLEGVVNPSMKLGPNIYKGR